jgi:putative DNA primase/helicase
MDIDNLPPMQHCLVMDEDGKIIRCNDEKVVTYLLNTIQPVTFSEDDIYYYSDGVYIPGGEILIKEILNKKLIMFNTEYGDPVISRKQSKEIIEKVRFCTMIDRSEFDKDLNIINMKNGLYNWTNGEFKLHDPKYKSLIQIPIIYNPDAKCPTILEVLKEIIEPKYFILCLEYLAYLLYRGFPIQNILILYGPGGTGKSVFLDLCTDIVGSNNYSSISLQDMANNKFAIHELYNKLLNICGDMGSSKLLDTDVFKRATGRDTINGEQKYKDTFKFKSFAKMVLSLNIVPPTNDFSSGFSRRLIIIQFLRKYKKEEYDYVRLAKLKDPEELSGLFNVVIKLLPDLINRSYLTGVPSEDETNRLYTTLSNPLLVFCRECIGEDPESYGIMKTYMYKQYSEFCKRFKTLPIPFSDFNKELQKQSPYIRTTSKMNPEEGKRKAAWANVSLTHAWD